MKFLLRKPIPQQLSTERLHGLHCQWFTIAPADSIPWRGYNTTLREKEHKNKMVKGECEVMFGIPSRCPRCKQTVFAAEQKLAEGKSWHNLCWSLEFKQREADKKAKRNKISYDKPSDVNPSYYRVADPETGKPARMESKQAEHVPVWVNL